MMFLLIPEIMSQPEVALSDSTKRPLMNIVDYLKSKIEQERQELVMTEGEIIRYMDGLPPPFSIYKDNFFLLPASRSTKE